MTIKTSIFRSVETLDTEDWIVYIKTLVPHTHLKQHPTNKINPCYIDFCSDFFCIAGEHAGTTERRPGRKAILWLWGGKKKKRHLSRLKSVELWVDCSQRGSGGLSQYVHWLKRWTMPSRANIPSGAFSLSVLYLLTGFSAKLNRDYWSRSWVGFLQGPTAGGPLWSHSC